MSSGGPTQHPCLVGLLLVERVYAQANRLQCQTHGVFRHSGLAEFRNYLQITEVPAVSACSSVGCVARTVTVRGTSSSRGISPNDLPCPTRGS